MNENLDIGKLIFRGPDKTDNVYHLQIGQNIIGRSKEPGSRVHCFIENDEKVSRHHCIIEVVKDSDGKFGFVLTDNNSSNGTYLHGFRKTRLDQDDAVYLAHGDRILIGDTIVNLELQNEKINNRSLEVYRKTQYKKTIII